MAHASTKKSEVREKDRNRQRKRRGKMRALGVPFPYQIDMAVSEALSFALTEEHERRGGLKDMGDLQVSYKSIVHTALRILVNRLHFDREQAAKALKRRLDQRPEHTNYDWTPHLKSCEPKFWSDVSIPKLVDTPVTPSGLVTHAEEEVTQI